MLSSRIRVLPIRQARILTFSRKSRILCTLAHSSSNLPENGHHLSTQRAHAGQDMARNFSEKLKLTSVLRSHGKFRALLDGRLTHTHVVSCGYEHDIVISNCILQMYGNCGIIKDAQAVFDRLIYVNVYSWNIMINVYSSNGLLDDAREIFGSTFLRDVVTWNAMIVACVQHGSSEEALCLFWSMTYDGIMPNNITFVSALDACANDGNIAVGRKIHITIICVGFEDDRIVGNALINFYGKHELVHDAHAVFSQMAHSDIVSWTAMLSAFVKVHDGREALNTFCLMQFKGIDPDKIAHICALDACATLAAYEDGLLIHSAVVESCTEQDVVVSTALINMYGECDSMDDAKNVFAKMPLRNVVSWTAMLAALSRNTLGKEALQLFHNMQAEGVNPNNVTLALAVDACTVLLSVVEGQEIHVAVAIRGFEQDVAISTGLINLYGKCGFMDDARRIFGRMLHKNVVSWSTMIALCTQNGYGKEALSLFHQMQGEGIEPNKATFLCLVDTCTSLATLEEGCELDKSILKCGFGKDVTLGNALVNMYRKCGSLNDAEMVFDRMASRNIVSWTAMIAAFAQMGHGENALAHFGKMLSEGLNPDSIVFTCILTACSHSGLVDNGTKFFWAMLEYFSIPQTIDHYVCMIDLLGRAGHLDDAEALTNQAPFQNLALPWLCLLGACRSCGDVARGLLAAASCFELDPQSATPYTMLGNIVITEDRFVDDVALMEDCFEENWYENG